MDNPMIEVLFPGSSAAGVLHLDPIPSVSAATSDDDADDLNGGFRAKKSPPWQRMKWTDEVVRLLITLVSYVGDDVTPDSARKTGAALQKKGKWKTVSKLMLENGCYVSPQQCEDKFNDLNKRYKRLNEILGRGTTCQVVENPNLLDSMPHISPKAKDDVRKILSSKHLFYREMCAYHNGQRIPHSKDINLKVGSLKDLNEEEERIPTSQDFNFKVDGPLKVGSLKDLDEFEDGDEEEEEEDDEFGKMCYDRFFVEIEGMLPAEQREWLTKRELQLLEERVDIEAEEFELENQRIKWERFRSKKDWEMERLTLENERLRLENERMVLLVRQKELELDSKREPSSMDGEQARVQ